MVKGELRNVVNKIPSQGYYSLYIDGGTTIQNFLKEDLIDEMIITIIPFLLGNGIPLFSKLPKPLEFECVGSVIYLGKVVQNRFLRV